jgi:predicted HAD superfamily Cof-like phosphohydrolase
MGTHAGEQTAASPEQMLREFHTTLSVHGGLAPASPTSDIPGWVRDLRLMLLDEEVGELREAMLRGDIEKIADGIADIVYVAIGTAVPYGIPFDAVFREVHRSNMTKTNDPNLGKLVKGPGYEAPRIAEILVLTPQTEGGAS